MKVAILDDYQNAALSMANWSGVRERAEITVFTDHVVDAERGLRDAPADAALSCHHRALATTEADSLDWAPQLIH